jgi:hypothetical protein
MGDRPAFLHSRFFILHSAWGYSSIGRAPPLHGGGSGFEPPWLHRPESSEQPCPGGYGSAAAFQQERTAGACPRGLRGGRFAARRFDRSGTLTSEWCVARSARAIPCGRECPGLSRGRGRSNIRAEGETSARTQRSAVAVAGTPGWGPAARVDGRVVDALACRADEGRGDAAKCLGERLPRNDPRMPEWSNPAGVVPRYPLLNT